MDKIILRDRFMECFQGIEKSALAASVRKFSEGELAVLQFIGKAKAGVNPSQISDFMNLSRSRVASILSSLRLKDQVSMEIDSVDRRKMTVTITAAGKKLLAVRHEELLSRLDAFIEALGAEDAEALANIAKKAAKALLSAEK